MAYLQIDSQHFFSNYHQIAQFIGQENIHKIAIVLKDNAYGHGLEEIAKLAKEAKITTCFVKNAKEALKIAAMFWHITILYPQSLEDKEALQECLKRDNIYFCVASLEALEHYPKHTKIELEINSGMNRNGICPQQLNKAFEIIIQKDLELIGVFSHNGFGDDFGSEFYTQNDEFLMVKKKILELCNQYSLKKPRFHFFSSSGALRAVRYNESLPLELQDDLFRIGIAFYGYLCQDARFCGLNVKPIASLWAKKISTYFLKKGSRIGYGGASETKEDTFVSSYDVGYGDGLFRLKEGMELKTKEGFKIYPRSSMDCLSIQGDSDELCIFEDVSPWAEAFGTIPYEILVHLQPTIPKKIV
ncbi:MULTISPECIES: alanine racemase [unclassified Helicobacter]|uniref:alanine racemase n=1 Tax=unclassified Helicobacter TaxID=2593540 RepID=UPI001F57B8C7|nr:MULTISPECIES: alanine racemase [unclassified Helicobacter]MCI2236668.1 alanine racemase [Helicobacter sp. CaF467b]MCI7046784.1 alanine racemase [Helicobacter sp.]MDY4426043.1 alanine racemase [Helicobacter sp.]